MQQMPIDVQQILVMRMCNDKEVLNDLPLGVTMIGTFHSIQSLSAARATVFEVNRWLLIIKTKGIHHQKSSTGWQDICAMSYGNELSDIYTHNRKHKKEHIPIFWGCTSMYFFWQHTFLSSSHPSWEMIKWEERVFAALNAWAMKVFPAVPTEVLTQPRTRPLPCFPWKDFILRMKKINNPDI